MSYRKRRLGVFVVGVLFCIQAPLFSEGREEKAAFYLCKTAKERNKERLAVFPFTDEKDEETPDTEKVTTKVIAQVLLCKGVRVIDKKKIAHVLEEQAMGETGLVDEETAPEIGKLIGANALVFGSVDESAIQIRLVDAGTGEVLGASVEESQGTKGERNVEIVPQSPEKAKNFFRTTGIRQWLTRISHKKPALFLYVSSTDKETREMLRSHPQYGERIRKTAKRMNRQQKQRFRKMRKTVLELRASDPELDKRIIQFREEILQGGRGKEGGQKGRRRKKKR